MNRGAMRTYLEALLADSIGESKLWSDTLKNQLIQNALDETLYFLPPELLEVVYKTPSNINLSNGVAEYGIEGAGFNLTDYFRWVKISVWDGTEMKEAVVVPQDKLLSSNYLYQAVASQPMVAIIPRTADSSGRQRAILISPTPGADKTGGLGLTYLKRHPTFTLDADESIIPVDFHATAMNHAAAFALLKAKKPDLSISNWSIWRERMIRENAKFGRVVEPPKEPQG